MPPPQLVAADAAYKKYPGSVFAFRCADWMAASRGTLTTTSDPLSCTGSMVVDSQKVSTSILSNPSDAYTEAEATLVIPLSGLPIEGRDYRFFLSYRIEGDWDTTNTDTLSKSANYRLAGTVGCGVSGFFGTAIGFTQDSNAALSKTPHFVTELIGASASYFMNEFHTITLKAFSQSGTTATWHLDQLILMPANSFLSPGQLVPGGWNYTYSVFGVGSADVHPEDGDDGGDANGQFTAGATMAGSYDDSTFNNPFGDGSRGSSGRAGYDFQKEDSEYILRVTRDDPEYPYTNFLGEEILAEVYSLHCARYREPQRVMEDDFSRSVSFANPGSGTWGRSADGYGWGSSGTVQGTFLQMGVNGSEGVHRYRPNTSALTAHMISFAGSSAAQLLMRDQFTFSGMFRSAELNAAFTSHASAQLNAFPWVQGVGFRCGIEFHLGQDTGRGEWNFVYLPISSDFFTDPRTTIAGPFDATSWYADNTWVAFKIEVLRYRIRARIWDPSGAEPSTWDYEDFIGAITFPPPTEISYPYGDEEFIADRMMRGFNGCQVASSAVWNATGGAKEASVFWDDIAFDYEPYGDPASMYVNIERPEGNEIASMEVPYGAAYFVHWGQGDWTDIQSSIPQLEFSSKVWNDPSAADLQRAEATVYCFVFPSPFEGIVSMNWRSADRGAAVKRVLVG